MWFSHIPETKSNIVVVTTMVFLHVVEVLALSLCSSIQTYEARIDVG